MLLVSTVEKKVWRVNTKCRTVKSQPKAGFFNLIEVNTQTLNHDQPWKEGTYKVMKIKSGQLLIVLHLDL